MIRFALAISLLLVATGCAEHAASLRLRKIGFVSAFSGYDATTAPAMLAAIKQAADRFNQDGGTQQAIEIVALDDGGTGSISEAKARELVADSAVAAVIASARGDYSFQTYRAAGLALLVVGGPAATGARAIALCAGATAEGQQAARYAKSLGASRLAVVAAAGEGFQEAAASFANSTPKPVASLTFEPSLWRTDRAVAEKALLELASNGFDFVYYSGPYDLAERLAPVASVGAMILAGSDADTPAFARLGPGVTPMRRIAVCQDEGTSSPGPQNSHERAARLAASAAESILQVMADEGAIALERPSMAHLIEEQVAKLRNRAIAAADTATIY